jgi:hypothetical protein
VRTWRAIGLATFLLCCAAALAPRVHAEAADDAAVRTLVERAYDRTLRAPGVRSVELAIHRGGRLVARRSFDVAYRRAPGASRALLRFTAPSYLRGDALLVAETASGASDVWLYQAGERRARRVGSTQHADAFYVSDLSIEELGHPRFRDWAMRTHADDATCACTPVEARPARDSQYAKLVLFVDRARDAIARIDFHHNADTAPVKRLTVSLEDATEEAGHLRVAHMRMEQIGRAAWTDVTTERMEIDPEIGAELFSGAALEREGDDLFSLRARHATNGAVE